MTWSATAGRIVCRDDHLWPFAKFGTRFAAWLTGISGRWVCRSQEDLTEAPSKPMSICKQIRCIIVVNPLVTMSLFLKHWGSGCQEWLVPRSGLRSHLGPGQVLSKDLNLASNHQYIGNWHMKGSHLIFGYTNGYQKTMIQEVGWEFAHTSSGYLMP